MIRFATASLAAMAALAMTAPAHAQTDAGDKVRMVIIYGDDARPEAEGDEILVVATMPESERYRIPEQLRLSDDPANSAWAQRVERFDFVGDFGTLSCSPSGAGGITGCTQDLIDAAYGARREGSNVRFSQLIEAARAERLSTIDADAAAEQERVESIEREYMERLERERQAEVPGEEGAALPAPESSGPVDDGGEDASGLDRDPGTS
ncbi:hypothetical protein [Parerythrobacter jejuensis]|uniref:Uncharacterized protein n=1 Tax=Parerythrobacter jejuensis TaxID=795812 RepID=A0A845AWJ0_9SPHN|nr:hypothetical protein [Parerythrobacter jejuensis]MXP30897.1 hypothetical protein [Parerythrobacter jejuensis]MXP33657.1 hypothetical protein [Parerythrobacter jejuensis]